jgi:pyruvate dehydrogenase E2 component (dihydrolipoamide acetyltransferase)
MATEILMPRQGNTVESCLLLEWKKQEGESVAAGEVLCEVETDKAVFEVEADSDGTVLKRFFEEGADVPVLTPIAVIGQPGEDISSFGPPQEAAAAEPAVESSQPAASPAPPSTESRPAAAVAPTSGELKMSPRARHLAAAKGLDAQTLRGSGPAGRIIERDVLTALADQAPLTPAAIAALVEQGVQAPQVGTGIGGRVTSADLQQPRPEAAAGAAAEFPGPVNEIPVKGVRKLIAERMFESLQSTAQVALNASADATRLLAYRKRLKAAPEDMGLAGVTITDLVLYAVAQTLPRFGFMNAHFLGDTIKEFAWVHLGVAVDTPRGLMVPAVRNAELLSLRALSDEARRLATACQDSKIQPDELAGATFTVTNLGALGIESFTPVLNPPEVGILGVCAIQPKPVMAGEEVSHVPHLGLSLTFDHRAVDGAPAARFLHELTVALAHFDLLLAGSR